MYISTISIYIFHSLFIILLLSILLTLPERCQHRKIVNNNPRTKLVYPFHWFLFVVVAVYRKSYQYVLTVVEVEVLKYNDYLGLHMYTCFLCFLPEVLFAELLEKSIKERKK